MIKVINIFLFIVCLILGFLLVRSIQDPIKNKNLIEEREQVVQKKLIKIRDAQTAYKDLYNRYARDFDTLVQVVKTGYITEGEGESGVKIIDSLFQGNVNEAENIGIVPFSNGKSFKMESGFIPNPSDSLSVIPVFEASTVSDDFLGGEDGVNQDYWKGGEQIWVGSMYKPSLAGSWE